MMTDGVTSQDSSAQVQDIAEILAGHLGFDEVLNANLGDWCVTGYTPFEGPNPRLDIDETNGFGPENINIDEPLPGDHHIYVHFYGIGTGEEMEDTRARIRIYINGILRADYSRYITKNDAWAVATVKWLDSEDATITPASPNADAPDQIGRVESLISIPPSSDFLGEAWIN